MGSLKCKVCGEKFSTQKELHKHVRKEHGLYCADYYTQYYPRANLLTGRPISYKGNPDAYFSEDFYDKEEMSKWIHSAQKGGVATWMLDKLSKRMKDKKLRYAPSHVELETAFMPSCLDYEYIFGSYKSACSKIGVEPLFHTSKKLSNLKLKNPEICIDTREQKPLKFKRSKVMALAFADYTLSGDEYNYTYVDRKSGSDFMGTFGKQIKRFEREMDKAIGMDSFVYVVIEESIDGVKAEAGRLGKALSVEYPFKNMREIMHKYPRKIQFIFTGSRENSQKIIPYLLGFGEEMWDYDAYFTLRKKGLV